MSPQMSSDVCPLATGKLIAGVAKQIDELTVRSPGHRRSAIDIVDNTQDSDNRRGQDRRVARLVIERDVAAGHRDSQGRARIGQTPHRFRELPHHFWIFRRPEVQAVGHRERDGSGDAHVPIRLRERQLSTRVGVKLREASVAVGRDSYASPRFFVDPNHPGVFGLGEDCVSPHVAVVLVGDPRLVGEIRRGEKF